METPSRTLRHLQYLAISLTMGAFGVSAGLSAAGEEKPKNSLQLPQEILEVAGRKAFVILPQEKNRNPHRPMPWVWYAPTLPKLPAVEESWMFERFLEHGIAIAGVDVGESYGSPAGREGFTALYRELTEKRGFSRKPCLLGRSRGGLMLYNWAAEHPECVAGIAGIYPVGNLRSWPGLAKASGAYGMTAAELEAQLPQHNPLDRLAPLAKAGVPIFHIHGDSDTLVPLAENSEAIAKTYRELGGSMRLRVVPGQGHNMWEGFFRCQDLVEFVIDRAIPVADHEPSPMLFREPPMDARPGAFWDWLNGNVNLARLTEELEEMKAKGMSGAEIWDIGILRSNPDAPVPAGPEFLGPEGIKAVNHAIDGRGGLRVPGVIHQGPVLACRHRGHPGLSRRGKSAGRREVEAPSASRRIGLCRLWRAWGNHHAAGECIRSRPSHRTHGNHRPVAGELPGRPWCAAVACLRQARFMDRRPGGRHQAFLRHGHLSERIRRSGIPAC